MNGVSRINFTPTTKLALAITIVALILLLIGLTLAGWKKLDNNATMAITAIGDNLYQLHYTDHIWRYTGTLI